MILPNKITTQFRHLILAITTVNDMHTFTVPIIVLFSLFLFIKLT